MRDLFHTVYSDPPWLERGGGKIKRGADKHYGLMKKEDIRDVMIAAEPWKMIAENAHHHMWATNNYLKDGIWLMEALGFRYITNQCWGKKRFGIGRYFRGKHELLLFGVKGNGFSPDVRTAVNNIPSFTETEETLLDVYIEVAQMISRQRQLPGWDPAGDQPMLAYLDRLWPQLSQAEQEFLDNENWRTWQDIDGTYVIEDHVFVDGKRKHSAKPAIFYDIIERRSKGPYLEMFARSSGREGWTAWGDQAPVAEQGAEGASP